jgi:hypothetical protein
MFDKLFKTYTPRTFHLIMICRWCRRNNWLEVSVTMTRLSMATNDRSSLLCRMSRCLILSLSVYNSYQDVSLVLTLSMYSTVTNIWCLRISQHYVEIDVDNLQVMLSIETHLTWCQQIDRCANSMSSNNDEPMDYRVLHLMMLFDEHSEVDAQISSLLMLVPNVWQWQIDYWTRR